jgi:integrase/recombinase XerD
VLVRAGLGTPRDHALIALLELNRLRISEALRTDIGDLDIDRGHRALRIVGKGGKHVTVPLAPRTARALDLCIGERSSGPIFVTAGGQRMDRSAADRTVKRLARRAGITKRISPHSLRHSVHHRRCSGRVLRWPCPRPHSDRPAISRHSPVPHLVGCRRSQRPSSSRS